MGKFFTAIIILALFLSTITQAATYGGGSGTAADPYKIATKADLLTLAATTADYSRCFIMTADIDLQGISFTPVGNSTRKFTGSFDGDGHIISNLTIHGGSDSGLFKCIDSGGQVKDLGVVDAAIQGYYWVGGLCGQNDGGSITGCYVTGTVTGRNSYVGGLCGQNQGSITDCYTVVTVTGSNEVGGLCGHNYHGAINRCYAVGAVAGNSSIGALCGEQSGSLAKIENSFWDTESSGLTVGYNLDSHYPGTVTNVVGKTTAEMMTESTFTDAGWDFSSIDGDIPDWIFQGVEYPHLMWEITTGIPNVVGMARQDAKAVLLAANFQGEIIYVVNDAIPADQVFSQSPAAGVEIAYGSTITLMVSPGPKYTGSGTETDPYQIANKYNLLFLSVTPDDYSNCFILTADIDMQDILFTPVGNSTRKFTGFFDGNGHTINNLAITGNSDHVGLFGYIDAGGQVKNLGIVDANIQGRHNVGGLCGDNNGSITGCYTTGAVTGSGDYDYVGGLCGANWNTISQCYTTSTVAGSSNYIGGLCGVNGDTISQCYATGAVTGSGNYTGGLCGYNSYGTTISQCYATGTVTGYSYAGGLCGYQEVGLIQNSFWDTESSGLTVGYNLDSSYPGTIINVVGKTTTEMMTESTFADAGWDFSNTDGDTADWILSGIEYPHLISEITVVNPDIVGMTRQDATAVLLAENLQTETTYIVNNTIPAGQVISQSPAAGTEIPCGSTSTLTVSLGPKYKGNGTEADPYQINTQYELLVLAMTPADYSSYFVLTADIDLEGQIFTTAIIAPDTLADWNYNFEGTDFTGSLDGDNYKITNFVIDGGDNDYLGLFGQIGTGGQVKNLGIENCSISSIYDSLGIGGLAGCNNGTLSHCYSTSTVTGDRFCGGLVGWNHGSISNCYSTGYIGGEDTCTVGGLAGSSTDSGSISNCYSTSTVIGSTGVGGLVGASSSLINHCYSSGYVRGYQEVGGLVGSNSDSNICNSYSIGYVAGKKYIGGLAGYNSGTISNCYSTDAIISGDYSTYVGGLVGYNSDGFIIKCYSAGTVTVGDYSFDIGGSVGRSVHREEIIENQCNLVMICDGEENCWLEEECADVFIGFEYVEDTSFVQFSFWDSEISGIYDSSGGEGRATSQMHDLNMFLSVGWDFASETANGTDDVWRMCNDSVNYPRLTWQYSMLGDFVCPDGVGMEDLTLLIDTWLDTWRIDSDIIDDSIVNMADLSIIGQNWMLTECGDCNGADVTGDGNVDIQDVVVFSDQWLFEENPDCRLADIDNDGKVDMADLSILAANWMKE